MSTTNSPASFGSLPRTMPATLCDSTSWFSTATLARTEMGSGKCGSALPSSAIFRISAKVWPEPSNSRSARAGLKAMDTCCPAVSSSEASASAMAGLSRLGDERSHGTSMLFGLASEIVPMAPSRFSVFQRSAADW